MSTQSTNEIKRLLKQTQISQHDLVYEDAIQVLHSPILHLVLKIATYFYEDGISKKLPCLHGTIPIQYKGNEYQIPIEIWLQEDHPQVAPLVYVKPTSNMHMSSTSKDVKSNGSVTLFYLQGWNYPESNLLALANEMIEAFSRHPPVFSTIHSHTGNVATPTSNRLPYPSNRSSIGANSLNSNMTSNNVQQLKDVHRFSDIAAEPQRMLLPIRGFETMPLVSLEEAVVPLVSLVPDIEQMVWITKQNCSNPKDNLTNDESASIMLYTMEWEPYEKSVYFLLNSALRAKNRSELKPWFEYLRLIVHALNKLPSTRRKIYRGVKMDLSGEYVQGKTIVWWGFASCTTSIEALENKNFLGTTGVRTQFHIECESSKDIRLHSFYGNEDETLLLPARQFEVISSRDQEDGLHIIQLKETTPKFPLIKLPSS